MSRSPQELHEEMALNYKEKLGKDGEKSACKYLKSAGWKVVTTNYKNPFGEVDIIAEKGEILAFIEVKTRTSESYGTPSEAVNFDRRRRYIMAAKHYFIGREIDVTVRFDIIEILNGQINHIENAFN